MDSSKIKLIVIVVLASLAAVYLGIAAATAQMEAVMWVGGLLAASGLFLMGRHVWILVPLALSLSGQINCIPGAPTAWYFLTPLAILFVTMRFLCRTGDFVLRWNFLDTLVMLNFVVLFQTYVRNPVGLMQLTGAEGLIGGRTYVDYALVTTGYLVLSTVKTEWKVVRIVLIIMVAMRLGDGLLAAATSLSGTLASAVSKVYGNVDFVAADSEINSSMGLGYSIQADMRLTSLPEFGIALGLFCFTFWRPLASFSPFRPYRPIMLAVSLVCILMGGFRSMLTRLLLLFVAGCFARRKPSDIVLGAVGGAVAISLLLVGDFTQQLPFAAQRALSFLPVGASQAAKAESDKSSEWRFQMWRMALTSDRYIHNKVLGDGFGFTADEFKFGETSMRALSEEQQMDFYMAKGSYHGFHVECIHFVGAVGLALSTCILFVAASYAWKMIRYYEGRNGWSPLLFFCIPYLIEPFYYWFVFGSYKGGFMTFMLGAGMLRILQNIRAKEMSDALAPIPVEEAETDSWTPLAVRRAAAR